MKITDHNHDKCVTTEHFAARLKQENLVRKVIFLIS